ncbi:MAG: AAA family ATPase [Thermosynechococcaceae cyanobacterium]
MLYIFGGLPGTGKSELASYLSQVLKATYLRIDTIEQSLRNSGMTAMGPEGYELAYRVAIDNLKLDIDVVADSVNPLKITRQAWRQVAAEAGVAFQEIEVICSDQFEHRRRVESRQSQVSGLRLPNWNDVLQREYDVWDSNPIVIDTAGHTAADSKQLLERQLAIKVL